MTDLNPQPTNDQKPSIKDKLTADLKVSMLAGNKDRLTVVRALKSVITYAEVAAGTRVDPATGEGGLSDDDIIPLFAREAKKRQESAELYIKGGAPDRAEAELAEKQIITEYLPAQIDESAIRQLVEEAIAATGASSMAQMGQVIGAVKAKAGASADGSVIAKLVKERLSA